MTFQELGLSDEVLQAIADSGYTEPTPIQQKAIPYVLMGRDVLGCAQTGTGKTASFTAPMIDILASGRARARMPRSLILEPTRELATQVAESFERYGKYNKLSQALLIGGSSIGDQEKKLDRGVDVLIATPGRLIDLYERGKILLADVRILVIDETDRMLDMGFIPDVERIVSLLPKIRQTLFFSATMPKEIRRLADQFLMNPKEIHVSPPASPAESVSQGLVRVGSRDKRKALKELLSSRQPTSALVFCNRKRDVSALTKALKQAGWPASELHGDMSQPERTETLERFRSGDINLLICSDVAARGLDIPRVSHVFNYDVPGHAEDYIHRIGRTGRAGRPGEAYMLATPADGKALAAIHRMLGRDIPAAQSDSVKTLPPEEVEKADGQERRGRRGRGRSERGREAEAAPAEAAPAEAAAPAAANTNEQAAEAAATEPEAPRKAKGRRRADGKDKRAKANADPGESKDEAGRQPAPEPEAKPRRKRGGEKRPGPGSNASKPFGEHTPAFLLRRVSA